MKGVILAGGKGTRLGPLTATCPKPMIPIGDLPLLAHQICWLRRYEVTDIILSIGHGGNLIRAYFGDGGNLGVSLTYVEEQQPLGTAGALHQLRHMMKADFLLLYGDVMLDVDLPRLLAFHNEHGGAGTLVLHPNDHPHDSDLVETETESKRVLAFHPKPHPPNNYFRNLVNAGLSILSPRIFSYLAPPTRAERILDLGRDVLPGFVKQESLYAYVTAEYLKDMGTPERLRQVSADFYSGRIARWNKQRKRPAVFIDRDGVLNRHAGFIARPGDVELLPGVAAGIRQLNDTEYLAIVVTNQPVVARNNCSLADLEQIHGRLEMLLARAGGKLDAIYFCPHHPDSGYPEENPAYKTRCGCRKPGTGMIERACEDFNIDLPGSYLIGDSWRDFECGRRAGLTTIGVLTGEGWTTSGPQPDHTFETLAEAIDQIQNGRLRVADLRLKEPAIFQSAICKVKSAMEMETNAT